MIAFLKVLKIEESKPKHPKEALLNMQDISSILPAHDENYCLVWLKASDDPIRIQHSLEAVEKAINSFGNYKSEVIGVGKGDGEPQR